MDYLSIPFQNNLSYDVSIWDSFNPDNASDAENNYLGHLTSLGIVKAKTTAALQPIRSSSVFVFQNASTGEPLARTTRGPLSTEENYAVGQPDEDAMTATVKFISFLMFNPEHPMTKAFYALWNTTTTPLMPGINAFFTLYPDYSQCTFQSYMMGIVYISEHPEAVITPFPMHSLSGLVQHWGGTWPDGLPDITISHFSFSFKNNLLQLGMYIDLSTLPYETPQVADNIKTLGYGDTTVKVTVQTNFQLSLGIFGTRLTIDFDDFQIPIGEGKSISITKPVATIDINPLFKFVVFTLTGILPATIFNTPVNVDISLTIDNDEAAIGAVIEGSNVSLPAPPGVKGLHFDSIGVGMGVFFEPPGLGFGIEGKFHIGDTTSGNVITLDDDSFALVCEYVGETIEPKYLAFYVPKLDLNTVVELFTNINAKIDVPVEFSNLSFRWSDSLMDAVVLPDGSLSPGGYGFSAAVDIFSFGFYGEANLDLNTGLTANVEVSPINWNNVFQLTGDGKGYSIKIDTAGNPIKNNFIPITQAEKDALAKATGKQIVSPGGACLIINTLSLPILHLNAKASLFDLVNYDITADINKSGISFELDYGALLTTKMVCNLTDFHNLYAEFGYHIDQSIPVPLMNGQSRGSIPLKADVDAHLSLTTSTSQVTITTGGQFDFEGYHLSFGDFSGAVNFSRISDLIGGTLYSIVSAVDAVFHELIDTAELWAAAACKGAIIGFDDAGKVVKNAYGKTKEEMVTILKGAGFAINDIANGLINAYAATEQDVATLMRAAAYEADAVAKVIKDVFGADSTAVAKAMNEAGYALDDISRGIKDAWNYGEADVASALKAIGYQADNIAGSLKNVFSAVPHDVAAALKLIGYNADDVAFAIKLVWQYGINEITQVMQQAGFEVNDICNSLDNIMGATDQDVADAFKQFGIIAQDTANAIKTEFGKGINDVASVLKQAGYATADVASALKSAFNTSLDAVASAMKQVGYAANDVKNAFDSLDGDFKSFADTAWNDVKNAFNPSNW